MVGPQISLTATQDKKIICPMKHSNKQNRKSQAHNHNLRNFRRFCSDVDEYILGLEPRLFPDEYYDETKPLTPEPEKRRRRPDGKN